jgi:hypothetical protein
MGGTVAEFHSESIVPAVEISPRNAFSVSPFEMNDRNSTANLNVRLISGYASTSGRENNGAPQPDSQSSTDTAA